MSKEKFSKKNKGLPSHKAARPKNPINHRRANESEKMTDLPNAADAVKTSDMLMPDRNKTDSASANPDRQSEAANMCRPQDMSGNSAKKHDTSVPGKEHDTSVSGKKHDTSVSGKKHDTSASGKKHEKPASDKKYAKSDENMKPHGFVPSGERVPLRPGTLLAPMPCVMVTCGSAEKADIVTVAWTGIVSTKPPTLYISLRPERYSHAIIGETGEFTVNLVPSSLSLACDWCGMYSGRDHDKFAECPQTLTPIPSAKVSCPTIAESPLALECKVISSTPLGSHDMFIASIEHITVDSSLMDKNGRLTLEKADLISFAHGQYFVTGMKCGDFGFSVRKKK